MSNAKKAIIAVIAVAAAGAFIGVAYYNANQGEETSGVPRNATPVQWEYPRRETIVSKVNAKGTVEFIRKETVYPSTQAQITKVHVKVGDEVSEGDVLITYDDKVLSTYRDQLAEAELGLRTARLGLQSASIGASNAELLQAEAAIEQARKTIADIEAQLHQFDLSIAQIEDNISTARQNAERMKSLYDAGAATRVEFENAEKSLKQLTDQLESTRSQRASAELGLPIARENERLARVQYETLRNRASQPASVTQQEIQAISIEQAELRVAQIQKNIDEFVGEERAPVSGTVLALNVREGEYGTTGRALMEIADISNKNLVVVVLVPENDAKNIDLGQEAEIKGAALGTDRFAGHISKIYPLAERKQVGNSVETVLTVEITPEEGARLRAGYSIDAVIITKTSVDALAAPLMSIRSDTDGTEFVYVIGSDYTAQRRVVSLGEYSGIYVEVDGVGEDEQIIVNPSGQIQEGVAVRPLQNAAGS
jgi:HlyD family secretion protein